LHWTAKETRIKLMNAQGIDFRQHLHIQPFTPATDGIIKASETKTVGGQSFDVHYEVHPDYVLTWAIG